LFTAATFISARPVYALVVATFWSEVPNPIFILLKTKTSEKTAWVSRISIILALLHAMYFQFSISISTMK